MLGTHSRVTTRAESDSADDLDGRRKEFALIDGQTQFVASGGSGVPQVLLDTVVRRPVNPIHLAGRFGRMGDGTGERLVVRGVVASTVVGREMWVGVGGEVVLRRMESVGHDHHDSDSWFLAARVLKDSR